MIQLDIWDLRNVRIAMTKEDKFTTEELLVIRSSLLNFKKAPFVPEGEKKLIDEIMRKLFLLLDGNLKDL